MAPAVPSSASSISSPEPKFIDDEYDKELASPSAEALQDVVQPGWKRLITGNAMEGYETQRALGSRHLMMIGAHKTRLFSASLSLS